MPTQASKAAAPADDDAIMDASVERSSNIRVKPPAPTCCMRAATVLLYLTYAFGLALGGVFLWWVIETGASPEYLAFGISAIFVGLAVTLSLRDLHLHLVNYVAPDLQRHYVRIIAMIPIYSLQSWLALRFPDSKVYLETCRECYEAYVLYSFYNLMLAFLGGKAQLAEKLKARGVAQGRERAKHVFPFCCLRGWKLGSRFIHRCTVGCYQYVLLRVLCSAIALITEATHTYGEGNFSPGKFYLWSTIIINISQVWTLYVLALFYVELRGDLKPLSPLGKFAIVKAVVFLSWWQGLGFSAAVSLGLIPSALGYEAHDVARALQNFVITVEMAGAAVAHHYVFSYRDFYDSKKLAPVVVMQRARAHSSHSHSGHRGHGAAAATGAVSTPDATPTTAAGGEGEEAAEVELPTVSVGAALVDIMPLDVLQDTATNLTTGFGLTHKWEKRRLQRFNSARMAIHEYANAELGAIEAGFAPGHAGPASTGLGVAATPGKARAHSDAGEHATQPPPSVHVGTPVSAGAPSAPSPGGFGDSARSARRSRMVREMSRGRMNAQ